MHKSDKNLFYFYATKIIHQIYTITLPVSIPDLPRVACSKKVCAYTISHKLKRLPIIAFSFPIPAQCEISAPATLFSAGVKLNEANPNIDKFLG